MPRRPDPISPEIAELFDYLMLYASTGNLGVISTLDRATGATRFTLTGQHPLPDGSVRFVPLGFLSTTAGDEVIPPTDEPPVVYDLLPERYDEFLLCQEIERDRWADDGGACV